MSPTHWIYPTNARSDYYLGNPDGGVEVSPERLLEDIEQRADQLHSWVLSAGFRIMRPGDAVWIYAADPYQYIRALARAVDIAADGDTRSVSLLFNLDATRQLMDAPIPRSRFGQIAQQAAVRANERTTEVLDSWLRSTRIQLVDLDSQGPDPDSAEDARFRTMRAIVQRRGQAGFGADSQKHFSEPGAFFQK